MELKDLFKTRYHLSDEALSTLYANMDRLSFSKRDVIQREGKMDYYLYFIEEGTVRSFITREDKEIAVYIAMEGGSPLSSSRLTRSSVSRIAINALTDCVLWRLSRDRLGELCENSLVFANLARELAEDVLFETELYWTEYYSLDKKEQYKLLMRQQPELFQRISLNEIASYLAITPQSLSRIRSEID